MLSNIVITVVLILPIVVGLICFRCRSIKLWSILFVVFGLISIPITFSPYQYSNWILRIGTNVFLIMTIAIGILLALRKLNEKSKIFIAVFFILVALLNLTDQGINLFASAFGGGNYPSTHSPSGDWKIDNYHIYSWWNQGFAGPEYHQYAIEVTALNGFVYRELDRITENNTKECVIKFDNGMTFDKCKEKFLTDEVN